MRYEPVAATGLLEPGEYDITIESVEEKQSKKGNDMLELIIHAYAPSGEPVTIFDYLVSSPASAWKIRNFCEAAGIDYDKGELDADKLRDLNLRAKLVTEEQSGYEPKNKIKQYLPATPKSDAGPSGAAKGGVLKDDDIPF